MHRGFGTFYVELHVAVQVITFWYSYVELHIAVQVVTFLVHLCRIARSSASDYNFGTLMYNCM